MSPPSGCSQLIRIGSGWKRIIITSTAILWWIWAPLSQAWTMPGASRRAVVSAGKGAAASLPEIPGRLLMTSSRSLLRWGPERSRRPLRHFPILGASSRTSLSEQKDDDDDDDENDEKNPSADPPRVKARFENLFAGMPSLGDILGSRSAEDDDEEEEEAPAAASRPSPKKLVDYSWFEPERQAIMDSYEEILQDMLADLERQRQADPDAVPDNAEALIKSVLKQEMDRELATAREQRAGERLQAYQTQQMAAAEQRDLANVVLDETVTKLMQDSEAEYQQQEASRALVEDFLKYEEEAFQRAAAQESSASSQVVLPEPGQNLDEWALERLVDMAQARQDDENGEMVLDILEDNLEDLRDRLSKQSNQQPIPTESLKEWQMYRSIATRLGANTKDEEEEAEDDQDDDPSEGDDPTNMDDSDQREQVLSRLQSWKEYLAKEELSRQASGLTRGPRLPFEWQESTAEDASGMTPPPTGVQPRSRADIRRQLNRMSIEAMESLVQKQADPARRAKLESELAYLKAELESKDYLDVEETEEVTATASPVDLSDFFSQSPSDDVMNADRGVETDYSPKVYETDQAPRLTAPVAFYATKREETRPPPPPNTPFFEDASETESSGGNVDSKLGSFEEQRLRSMYRRAGAKTEAERQELRRKWEEFQRIEEMKRAESGLGTASEEAVPTEVKMNYNLSDVVRGDGDIDAEKILASIGPRPKRQKPAKPATSLSNKTISDEEVVESLYRSVSAVGGGRYKDDEQENERVKNEFEDYLQKEAESRRVLDQGESKLGSVATSSISDSEAYAKEVLAALGPRPKPRRQRIRDEGAFSDQGGALASTDDEEEEEDDDEGVDDMVVETGDFLDASSSLERMGVEIPEWLRIEQEEAKKGGTQPRRRKRFLGNEIEEAFDDDNYEKNMRQLAEYERRRSGKAQQMGIDISDVLGRTALESKDYADFKDDNDYFRGRKDEWGSASFQARKASLLEYKELDLLELKSLMDHRDSVYTTGVSQYLPRINKPFKEFGAIFRLEGVLVDVSGLQYRAWSQVAEEFGFKTPQIEDVRRAAVLRPVDAIMQEFMWTDDPLECRRIVLAHQKALKNEFEVWMRDNDIKVPADSPRTSKGSLALGVELILGAEDQISSPSPATAKASTEVELVRGMVRAWELTADHYRFPRPPEEVILQASSISPDITVSEIFGWSNNPVEIASIVSTYRQIRAGETVVLAENSALQSPASSTKTKPTALNESQLLELHYHAWKQVSHEIGVEPPSPDEVMAAFVLNDPAVAVRDGFGWTADTSKLREITASFHSYLSEGLGVGSSSDIKTANDALPLQENRERLTANSQPSTDDVYGMALEAWSEVAEAFQYDTPDEERLMVALALSPTDAVVRAFKWTTDRQEAEKLATLYLESIARRRAKIDTKSTSRSVAKSAGSFQQSKPGKSGPSSDDVFKAVFDAWTSVAKKMTFPAPSTDQVEFALCVGPEEAVLSGFGWTTNSTEVTTILETYKAELAVIRAKWQQDLPLESQSTANVSEALVTPIPGVSKWIQSLQAAEMPCCVVSNLDSDQVAALLSFTGLSDLFGADHRVTASSGYGRDSQQLLGAALRVERRPDYCVVFDSSPQASKAAHEVEMRSVNIIGPYPRYDLLAADTTSSSFEELTAMNIRRLFGERVYDQPMLDMQQVLPENRKKRKTKIFLDDD